MDLLNWFCLGMATTTSVLFVWRTNKAYKEGLEEGFREGATHVLNEWKETMKDE